MLSVKPDEKVLRAFDALNGNMYFDTIKLWLSNNIIQLGRKSVLTRDEIDVRWNQGALQVLNEIVQYADNSRQELENIKQQRIDMADAEHLF